MQNKINWPAASILVILPIILIALTVHYTINFGVGIFEVVFIISTYYIANITVGIGLHRLWSHDSYKTNKYVEFILVLLSAGTLQGPALSWASNHFKHHTYTDTPKDPHSPLKYKNPIKGFFWSHMGWMLEGEGSYKSIDRVTLVKLGRNKLLKWQMKYYWQIASFMNIIVPGFIGFMVGGDWISAYAGFLFAGVGRAIQQQITFFVNSLCHFVGTKKYVKGTAGDVWWLALFLLGENWHNFHHAFPSDYRNGAKWYQFDVHKWIIYLMSVVGLAWDLKRTEKVRVDAKVSKTMHDFIEARKNQLEMINIKIKNLSKTVQDKLSNIELDGNSNKIKTHFNKSLKQIQNNLTNVRQQLNSQFKDLNNVSEKMINAIANQVKEIDDALQQLSAYEAN